MIKSSYIYTIENFENISKNDFKFELSQEVIDVINILADKVGAPSYNRTPTFNTKNINVRPKNNDIIKDSQWKSIRNQFETTDIISVTGMEKSINDIRTEINKITNDTYKVHFVKIVYILNSRQYNNTEKNIFANLFYDVSTSNKHNSRLYIRLLNDLNKFTLWLVPQFLLTVEKNNIPLSTFITIDPEEDYDGFCRINKINETRQGMAYVYIHMFEYGVISIDVIFNIISKHKLDIMSNLEDPDKINMIDILSDTISILFTGLYDCLLKKSLSDPDQINLANVYKTIECLSTSKSVNNKGLSNKTIFKCMDIIDKIKKDKKNKF